MYNFEITVLKNHRNTVHRVATKIIGYRRLKNARFFLPKHVFPATKQVSLAKQPRSWLHGTVMDKPLQ